MTLFVENSRILYDLSDGNALMQTILYEEKTMTVNRSIQTDSYKKMHYLAGQNRI